MKRHIGIAIAALFLIASPILAADTPAVDASRALEQPVAIPTPLGSVNIQEAIGHVIINVLGMVGSIALVMFIYGGFLYMTAQGNEEQVTKGKKTLVWASLGLVVVFGAYAMVNFVVSTLSKPPTAPPAATAPSG
ncbi:MAG: pilin [Patescibacteria group bacterium]